MRTPILFFIIMVGFILVLIYSLQQKALFAPMRRHVMTPSIPHQSFYVGDVHVWHFDQINPDSKRTILFAHGNSGNISHRGYMLDTCRRQGINLCLFDYRGYGKSRGVPSSTGVIQDGLAVYRYLQTKVPPCEIIVWGESLGGAVATRMAAETPCHSLILQSTFSALDDMVRHHEDVPLLMKTLNAMCAGLFDTMCSHQYLKQVRNPVVIMHSKEDELIPYTNAEKMYQSIQHPRKLFLTIKGSHAKPILTPDLLRQLFDFCSLPTEYCDDVCSTLHRYHRIYPGRLVRTPEEYEKAFEKETQESRSSSDD